MEQFVKERNRTEIAYYQERFLSREHILNQECVLNHLEIFKRFFLIWSPEPPPLLWLRMPRTERNVMTVLLLRTERNGTEWNKNKKVEKEGTRTEGSSVQCTVLNISTHRTTSQTRVSAFTLVRSSLHSPSENPFTIIWLVLSFVNITD